MWRTNRKIVKVFQWILPWSSSIPAGLWTASAILSKNTNININTEEIIIKIYDEIIFIHLIIKLHKLFPCFLKENFTYLCTMVERIIHVNLFRMGTFQLVTILRRAFQKTGTLFSLTILNSTFFVYMEDFANKHSNDRRIWKWMLLIKMDFPRMETTVL